MFGYDFKLDHEALTGGEHPRVDVKHPERSLILNKPTSDDDHGGGLRYEKGGWEYRLLRRWIAAGAKGVPADAASLERLEITPKEIVFDNIGQSAQLRAVAVWSDGSREDVTCLTRFRSNDEAVAKVSSDGLIEAQGRGDTYIISFYDNGVSSTQVLLPAPARAGAAYPKVPTPTAIDELVVQKLRKLGVVPSQVCSDAEFLRRVSLDLIGTLPTPREVLEFVADPSPSKRAAKIDELLEHPAYVEWWTQRLCDLTGSNAGYLGSTEMAQPVAQQWRDWIRRRVRDNIGYDKIVAGMVLATSRKPGQSYEDFVVEQSAYTRRQNPADFTALDNPMPHFWFRGNINDPKDKALAFGYTFLGVRLQCAQCHKHPYDQWSKRDFEQFTEFFTRIADGVAPDALEAHNQLREKLGVPDKLDTAALRRQMYLRVAAEGLPIPWQEVYIAKPKNPDKPEIARVLGGQEVDLRDYEDPRTLLMEWLLKKNNAYFASSFVNRIWASYFNVGVIEPPDDLNLANPPGNKALLNYLSREFVAHGYDMKWLHREIVNSRTYQLSWRPNETNRADTRNFSHAVVRRLPAEVAIDAILQSTVNDPKLPAAPRDIANRKIAQHPKSFQARSIDFSLLVFGKPLRTTTCDCERTSDPSLLQSLYLRNDTELHELLQRGDGWLQQLANELGEPLSLAQGGAFQPATAKLFEAKLRLQRQIEEAQAQDDKQRVAAKRRELSQTLAKLPAKLRTLDQLPDGKAIADELIEAAYLRTLSRKPNKTELADCREHLHGAENTVEGLRDLMWALLNTREFITNH